MENKKKPSISHRRMSREELAKRLSTLQKSAGRSEAAELNSVLHELEVSQIELEVQNRELVDSRRAVDQSHDRFIDLFDFAPVGYVTLNKNGLIKEINLSAAELFGTERHHLIGRSLVARVSRDDRHKLRDHLHRCKHTEQKLSTELLVVGRDGVEVPVQISSTITRDRITGELHFRNALTDLTQQKRAEMDLVAEKTRAELASQTKSAFLANMSHEIRTPLAAILGFAELMKTSDCPDERARFAHVVSRNGLALTKLIDDILDLTKVEAGRLQLERVNFNVRNLIGEITTLFQVPVESKQLEFSMEIDPRTPDYINSDPTRIRQILINLIGNAVKFTSNGSIFVFVEPVLEADALSEIKIHVKDTGIGMSPQQAARMFQPFCQADDSTTRRFGGSGLGLALSRKLAHALGGEIEITQCAPGKGCTLVATVAAGPVGEWVRAMAQPAPPIGPTASQSKILLVEDSLDNQELVKLVLLKAGMIVDVANNGAEGIKMAETNDYDVVLMDMQMPILDGYAATERLRQDGYNRPIVALTAHGMVEDRERSLELGCDAHLTKPLDSKLLIETIWRLQIQNTNVH